MDNLGMPRNYHTGGRAPRPHGGTRLPPNNSNNAEELPTPEQLSERLDQVLRGDYYACYDYYDQDRVNVYKLVDSWRSYRQDTVNLQSSTNPPTAQSVQLPLGSTGTTFMPSTRGLNIHAAHFTPYQALRSVHNYARYPTYRVNKVSRVSDGDRERHVVQQASGASRINHPTTSRYNFRDRGQNHGNTHSNTAVNNVFPPNRQRDRQGNVLSGVQPWRRGHPLDPNQAIPSVEAGDIENGIATLIPSALPSRFADRPSRTRTPESVTPPPAPKAAAQYLENARKSPEILKSPKKLLVILDLNGTLLVRPNGRANPTNFKLRPGVSSLLDYLFANHIIMVYSSARPENVGIITNKLFSVTQRAQLAAVWSRDKLDLTEVQYRNKIQVYKKLGKVWADNTIQASASPGQKWDQSNTVLVDDSHLKALAQPHNLVQITEFENNAPRAGGEPLFRWQKEQQEILESLQAKLEVLKWQVNVSRLIREWQAGAKKAPGVVDETVDQKTGQAEEIAYPPSPKSDKGGVSLLDILEEEIDRGLQNTRLNDVPATPESMGS